jgi:MSHA biogenesis protein MshK
MRDPTQPPAGFSNDFGQSTATLEDADALKPVLSTIIRRHGAKPVAVINGETVRLGGKIGDWVLVRIDESEVVLKGQDGRETLTLSPDVEKMPVKAVAGKKATLRGWE